MCDQISDDVTPVESVNLLNAKKPKISRLLTDSNSSFDDSINNNIFNQLEAIKKSLKEVSEIDETRVLHLKTEIALGNYKVNSDKIAMKMLNNIEMA
ncbi:flagellar biosynthesis anti-sigma factor FlgM [Legionella sp.]|uniref:flagellar biosynthesis anti-sigma factor FlgM n=1 Tax=Legionella sp. TaxID=459 RepID=UPI003CA59FDA